MRGGASEYHRGTPHEPDDAAGEGGVQVTHVVEVVELIEVSAFETRNRGLPYLGERSIPHSEVSPSDGGYPHET
jgi:hypothetical protein